MRSRVRGTVPGRRCRAGLLVALMTLPVSACENLPLAMGDFNSIIVTADPELWEAVQGDLVPALEKTVFTVRDEKIFTVMQSAPGTEAWFKLRLFKQKLVIGTEADPWMVAPLEQIDEPVSPPQIVRGEDVWARGQVITAVVLEEGNEVELSLEREASRLLQGLRSAGGDDCSVLDAAAGETLCVEARRGGRSSRWFRRDSRRRGRGLWGRQR